MTTTFPSCELVERHDQQLRFRIPDSEEHGHSLGEMFGMFEEQKHDLHISECVLLRTARLMPEPLTPTPSTPPRVCAIQVRPQPDDAGANLQLVRGATGGGARSCPRHAKHDVVKARRVYFCCGGDTSLRASNQTLVVPHGQPPCAPTLEAVQRGQACRSHPCETHPAWTGVPLTASMTRTSCRGKRQ